MALIEIFHVVADEYPVDPDWSTPDLLEGLVVRLTQHDGYAARCNATSRPIGIAGDTQSNTISSTPYAASLIVNAAGATRQTENRVSDFFKETLASGKMTVYHSGGTFATDLFDVTVDTAVPGDILYSNATGRLTTTNGGGLIVATCVAAVKAWPSGVPGVDTTDGSISLGDYVTFKLEI